MTEKLTGHEREAVFQAGVEHGRSEAEALVAAVGETVGFWLSAAQEDPDVCDAMKADIDKFFLATSGAGARAALDRLIAEAAPKVKALVWNKHGEAKGGGAKYNVYEAGSKGLWNCVCYPHEDAQYRIVIGVSEDFAKAAAQADFERRVMECLE